MKSDVIYKIGIRVLTAQKNTAYDSIYYFKILSIIHYIQVRKIFCIPHPDSMRSYNAVFPLLLPHFSWLARDMRACHRMRTQRKSATLKA